MLQQVLEILKQYAPEDYDRMPKEFPNIELILKTHKEVIESKLMKYSNYTKIDTNDIKRFNVQEVYCENMYGLWSIITICVLYMVNMSTISILVQIVKTLYETGYICYR